MGIKRSLPLSQTGEDWRMPTIFYITVTISLIAETCLKDTKQLIIIRVITLPILIGLILLGIFGFLD